MLTLWRIRLRLWWHREITGCSHPLPVVFYYDDEWVWSARVCPTCGRTTDRKRECRIETVMPPPEGWE